MVLRWGRLAAIWSQGMALVVKALRGPCLGRSRSRIEPMTTTLLPGCVVCVDRDHASRPGCCHVGDRAQCNIVAGEGYRGSGVLVHIARYEGRDLGRVAVRIDRVG